VSRVAKVRSRVLVIDASLAPAAGEASMHPTSRHCREFLQAVLDLCHHMAITPDIQDEWNRHQSGFARRWRISMMARKKIESVDVSLHVALRQRIERAVGNKKYRTAIEKDRRLIEAALATEQRVISLDDLVREYLRDHSAKLPEVRSICWVNPCTLEEHAVAWLEAGAPAERSRLLGFTPPRPET
jgi:hypothetical protein